MEPIVRESLEVMLRRINREAAVVKARLQRIAARLGVGNWRELEKLLTSRGIDNLEIDLLWPEYLYLKRRLRELEERKKRILAMLKG
ncbi:MAG: hypothetical protein GSR85_01220 [Desulfurococcales archaeon]|nr:hypothetical protein [Desulfurococcales archaeon]